MVYLSPARRVVGRNHSRQIRHEVNCGVWQRHVTPHVASFTHRGYASSLQGAVVLLRPSRGDCKEPGTALSNRGIIAEAAA